MLECQQGINIRTLLLYQESLSHFDKCYRFITYFALLSNYHSRIVYPHRTTFHPKSNKTYNFFYDLSRVCLSLYLYQYIGSSFSHSSLHLLFGNIFCIASVSFLGNTQSPVITFISLFFGDMFCLRHFHMGKCSATNHRNRFFEITKLKYSHNNVTRRT